MADARASVSVVIPTHNRAELLVRALRSVQAQTRPAQEIFVVDDGSTDDTRQRLEALGDERVRYLRNDLSRGAAAARNRGIREASGDVVAFLDSDDEWVPGNLELQLPALEAGHADVSYGRHVAVHPDGRVTVHTEPLHGADIRARLLAGWCPATTSLFVARREALLRVDGFDTSLPSFHDYDLWLRLSEVARFTWVDAPVLRFHLHEGPRISAQIRARERAFERFLAKWEPTLRGAMGDGGFREWLHASRAMDLRRAGVGALKAGRHRDAVVLLARALRQRPRQLRSYGHLAVALLGPGVYRAIARRRRGPADGA